MAKSTLLQNFAARADWTGINSVALCEQGVLRKTRVSMSKGGSKLLKLRAPH
jgi:hypothetical protein